MHVKRPRMVAKCECANDSKRRRRGVRVCVPVSAGNFEFRWQENYGDFEPSTTRTKCARLTVSHTTLTPVPPDVIVPGGKMHDSNDKNVLFVPVLNVSRHPVRVCVTTSIAHELKISSFFFTVSAYILRLPSTSGNDNDGKKKIPKKKDYFFSARLLLLIKHNLQNIYVIYGISHHLRISSTAM